MVQMTNLLCPPAPTPSLPLLFSFCLFAFLFYFKLRVIFYLFTLNLIGMHDSSSDSLLYSDKLPTQ